MSIKEFGHIDYFGEKCVYIQDNMYWYIVPVNDSSNIYSHTMDENYLLPFSTIINHHCIASVKKIDSHGLNYIRLELNYISKCLNDVPIDGFIMVGNEIDEFFSPLEYYFHKRKQEQYKYSDLLYDYDVINTYNFNCNGKTVDIELLYGNVLVDGIKTDLTIHPKLKVKFESTKDTDFIFEVYSTIIKFLQFVHRKQSYNIKRIELFENTGNSFSIIGYMFGSMFNVESRPRSRIDASFIYYGDKISNILSIIADNKDFPLKHLCQSIDYDFEYSSERLSAISSAFEYEYEADQRYQKQSDLALSNLKQQTLGFISSLTTISEIDSSFKDQAMAAIKNVGSQPGLKTKIINAYHENSEALSGSNHFLLFKNQDIDKVANTFARLRGKILHRKMGYTFNDEEIECIRFVEILQFAMTLKRAGYLDKEIELILGPLYHCNDVYLGQLK